MSLPNDIDGLLRAALEAQASDLHLKSGHAPVIRINGRLRTMESEVMTTDAFDRMICQVVPERLRKTWEQTRELDLSYHPIGLEARFRVNVFFQKTLPAAVFRQIPDKVPSLDGLGFKPILKELTRLEQGLILVTGPTGSGKSTTLAAMIDEINRNEPLHIVTIEDPIEFVHREQQCLINQREVGQDTLSFNEALRRVLRQDPDVILIGEMRDAVTISISCTAAETGHLVFSTLHTNDAKQSIDRIVNTYPHEEHHQVRMKLALVLRAVISQRLLPKADGAGRVAVQEIMINTPTIRKLIETGEIGQIDAIIEESVTYYKMQSLNQALMELWRNKVVAEQDALAISNNPNDLRLKIQTELFGLERGDAVKPPSGWEPQNKEI